VLPDIILLKNYEPSRRLLLENTELSRIDWWGAVFVDATIDACSMTWRRKPPRADHLIRVRVHDEIRGIDHETPQAAFAQAERACFNLYLTSERQGFLSEFSRFQRLADAFEAHEGVHSGNMRASLFVSSAIDQSCRPLVVGGDELEPFRLNWSGKYIRLGVVPGKKTKEAYANVGKPSWFESPKVVVQRTGDSIKAAVDTSGNYLSNNFFVVVPRGNSPLTLYGLSAVLNSALITKYFRHIEPREGRAFAEVKIKHLNVFPIPVSIDGDSPEADELDAMGRKMEQAAGSNALSSELRGENDRLVERAFRLPSATARLGVAG
jgi:hypothetical protein